MLLADPCVFSLRILLSSSSPPVTISFFRVSLLRVLLSRHKEWPKGLLSGTGKEREKKQVRFCLTFCVSLSPPEPSYQTECRCFVSFPRTPLSAGRSKPSSNGRTDLFPDLERGTNSFIMTNVQQHDNRKESGGRGHFSSAQSGTGARPSSSSISSGAAMKDDGSAAAVPVRGCLNRESC